MRPVGFGLAIAIVLSLCASSTGFAPSSAVAAKPAAPAAPAITADQRKKGMAAAPALLTKAGVVCQLADARFMIQGSDAKTKKPVSYYEVACTGGLGYVLVDSGKDVPVSYQDCLHDPNPMPNGAPDPLACLLPGNAAQPQVLQPYVVKVNTGCDVDKARSIGHSDTSAFYEVLCKSGGDYLLQVSSPPDPAKPTKLTPCLAIDPTTPVACKFVDQATQLAVADKLMAGSGHPCTIKNRKYVGVSTSNETMFEVACQEGKGYVVVQAANGSLSKAVDCVNTDICELTDARTAKTEQAGLYTKLARAAGFQCDVKSYAVFPSAPAGKEAVELVCNNRPDGAVGIFGATATNSTIYDCAHAELVGYRCSMSKADASLPTLTADLHTLGKDSCVVSESRVVGLSAEHTGFIEVACADGLPGFFIEFNLTPLSPKGVLTCRDASGMSGGCKLAGNTKTPAKP